MGILIIIALTVGAGFIYFINRAKLAGSRTVALSDYVARFDLNDTVRLHDWALSSLVNMHTHSWGRAHLTEADFYNFHLESVVALRDRFDGFGGKEHGPSNKAAIRAKLAFATSSLSKQTHYENRFQLLHDFKLGERCPSDGVEWLGLHLEMMERIYLHLGQADPIPGLESRSHG